MNAQKATLLQNRRDQSAGKLLRNGSGKELSSQNGSKSVDKPRAGG